MKNPWRLPRAFVESGSGLGLFFGIVPGFLIHC